MFTYPLRGDVPQAVMPGTHGQRRRHRLRILKKYPNHRLNDTSQSCFIELEDVKQWGLAGELFEVHDSKTGEAVTRTVLLQSIAEQEGDNISSRVTDEVLRQLIRLYADSPHSLPGEYLPAA